MEPEMMGNVAAVVVSMLWTACSIFFSAAGKRIGAISVNTIRISAAVGLLGTAHLIWFGALLPAATGDQWFYLGLSGFIGLAVGDIGYIGALVLIGPRRGVLLMSTAPIFAAVAGYAMLGEQIGAWALAGIAVTMSGVMLAILDDGANGKPQELTKRQLTIGYGLAVMGSACQGVGAAAMWVGVLAFGRLHEIRKATKDGRGVGLTFSGAITGPFLGVWLSMVAVSLALTGVAQTLMSLMPVMVIPVVWLLYKQGTGWRGIAGACIAIVGVAMLFIV